MKPAHGPQTMFLFSMIVVEISDVQIQVETERDVLTSSTLIGVSARTFCL